MIYNRIPIVFGPLRSVAGPTISYQYDVKQFLVIKGLNLPDRYEVDFANEGDARSITMLNTENGVQIPDDFLLTGKRIKAYIVLQGEDEGAVETRYEITLPVKQRPARTDIQPTPAEQLQIDTLVAALNDAVDDAESSAGSASKSAQDAAESAEASERYAELSAESASVSGWVRFYIDVDGDLHYVKTENTQLDFYIDSNGDLHVTEVQT